MYLLEYEGILPLLASRNFAPCKVPQPVQDGAPFPTPPRILPELAWGPTQIATLAKLSVLPCLQHCHRSADGWVRRELATATASSFEAGSDLPPGDPGLACSDTGRVHLRTR